MGRAWVLNMEMVNVGRSRERKASLDIAKAVGVFIVLINHAELAIGKGSYYLGAFYMPLFFIIAGMTYRYRPEGSYLEFVKKKARRLLVPYVLYNAFLFCFSVLKHYLLEGNVTRELFFPLLGCLYSRNFLFADELGGNVFFLTILNSPLWFLTALFLTLALYDAVSRLTKHKKKWMLGAMLLCLAFSAAFRLFLPILLPWSADTVFLCMVFVFVGELITEYEIMEKLYVKSYWLLLFLAVFIAVVNINGSGNMSVRDYGKSEFLYLFGGCCGTVLCIFVSEMLARYFKLSGAVLKAVGSHTIILLGMHMFCFTVFQMGCSLVGIDGSMWIMKLVMIIGTVTVLTVSNLLFDKYLSK